MSFNKIPGGGGRARSVADVAILEQPLGIRLSDLCQLLLVVVVVVDAAFIVVVWIFLLLLLLL